MGSGAPRRAPSMADVAAAIGVSHQTVSRVLNGSPLVREDTRERVLAAINGDGLPPQQRRPGAGHQPVRPDRADLGAPRRSTARAWSWTRCTVPPSGPATRSRPSASRSSPPSRCAGPSTGCSTRRSRRWSSRSRTATPSSPARSLKLSIPVVLAQGVTEAEPMAAGIDQVAGAELATEPPARPRPRAGRPHHRAPGLGGDRDAARRLAGRPRGARPRARARADRRLVRPERLRRRTRHRRRPGRHRGLRGQRHDGAGPAASPARGGTAGARAR